jgi:hypothetical protein
MSDTKSMAERLKESVLRVTKEWAKQRRSEERHASAAANRCANLIRPSDYHNFRSASFKIMKKAYMAASANGTLPTSARQVMYQARPLVQDMMGGEKLNDQYFCQQLLPDYMEEHEVDWDVVYDDRGHLIEPHTGYAATPLAGAGASAASLRPCFWGPKNLPKNPGGPQREVASSH